MRLRPVIGHFPVIAMGIFMSLPVIGQERGERANSEVEIYSRDIAYEPGESESKSVVKSNQTTLCDSMAHAKSTSSVKISSKPVENIKTLEPVKQVETPKAVEKSQKQEDPLSFNFLYYLIEKFKMSDMVE